MNNAVAILAVAFTALAIAIELARAAAMTDFCAADTVPLEVAIQARAVLANHGATDVAEALVIDDARRDVVYEFTGADGRAAGWMWPL